MQTIEWIVPTKQMSGKGGRDISVRMTTAGRNGKEKTAFIFRNGAERKITHGSKIIVGISPDRVFFKEADKGYSLSKNGNAYRVVIPASLKDAVGDYDLQYHEQMGMWFIGISSR